ncbi:hypothetical protein, partial [Accumulibacter sp.]|uniref:hypothetical protein n=1 Tax=Accumulibacter sp. TaxID=2053492 RepID=UPI002BD8FA2E
MELEAHGRIASAVEKPRENRASSSKKQRISAFQSQFHRPDRLKPDRLLASTMADPPVIERDFRH